MTYSEETFPEEVGNGYPDMLYVYQPCQCHRLYKAKTSYSFSYFCLKVIDAWLYFSHIANVLATGFLVVNVSLFIFEFSQH